MAEEKQADDRRKDPAEAQEREGSLSEEVSEGKSLAGRIARKLGEQTDERLKEDRGH